MDVSRDILCLRCIYKRGWRDHRGVIDEVNPLGMWFIDGLEYSLHQRFNLAGLIQVKLEVRDVAALAQQALVLLARDTEQVMAWRN
ncbi:hypothetical protein D3C84_1221360 [compost metagenome]